MKNLTSLTLLTFLVLAILIAMKITQKSGPSLPSPAVLSAEASEAIGILTPLRAEMALYYHETGRWPEYLSDIGIYYPYINSPRGIRQVRTAEDGKYLIAILESGESLWIGFRAEILGGYPHINWTCEKNFDLPPRMLTFCETSDKTFPEHQASIDCQSAQNRADQAICRHDHLMVADNEMNNVYQEILQLSSPNDSPRYEAQQLAWLEERRTFCERRNITDKHYHDCLRNKTRARISALRDDLRVLPTEGK